MCNSTVPVIPISALFEILYAVRDAGGKAGSPIDHALCAFLGGSVDQGKGVSGTPLGAFASPFPSFADFFSNFKKELVKSVKTIGWLCETDQVIESLASWNENSTLVQMSIDLVSEFEPKVNFTFMDYDVVLN